MLIKIRFPKLAVFWTLDEYEGGGAAKTSGGAESRKTACWNLMGFRVPPLRTPFYNH